MDFHDDKKQNILFTIAKQKLMKQYDSQKFVDLKKSLKNTSESLFRA